MDASVLHRRIAGAQTAPQKISHQGNSYLEIFYRIVNAEQLFDVVRD